MAPIHREVVAEMVAAKKKVVLPSTFLVPANISGVIGLLTARKWEKAATVDAFTVSSQGVGGGRPSKTSRETPGSIPAAGTQKARDWKGTPEYNAWLEGLTFPCSFEDFARIGISGLSDPKRVRWYAEQWQEARKKRWAKAARPGESIEIPTKPFPLTGHDRQESEYDEEYASEAARTGTTMGTAKRAGSNPAAVEAAVAADPEVAKAALKGLKRRVSKKAKEIEERNDEVDVPETKIECDLNGDDQTFMDEGSVIGGLVEAGLEAALRYERLEVIRDKAKEASESLAELLDEIGATGEPNDIEILAEIGHYATELAVSAQKLSFEEVTK